MTERHRIIPPVYFLLALSAMAALHKVAPIKTVFSDAFNGVGALLVVVGILAGLWAAGLFRKAGTPVRPFEPATVLVTGGIYKMTRNPMYLGMTGILIGVAVLLGTLSSLVPIPLFVWWIQRKFVQPEEEFLETIFGQNYVDYKARVRRWL